MSPWSTMLIGLLAGAPVAANATVSESTNCWLAIDAPTESIVCTPSLVDNSLVVFKSMRALRDAGWTVVEIAADRRRGEGNVRLLVERNAGPAWSGKFWPLIFPPP
jgi:hypothetical protein